jgi:hypothetical protein
LTELVELWDAGFTFYAADFWAVWDLGIIAVGIAFFVSRMVGLSTENHMVTDTAFDILALEALLLVPRSGHHVPLVMLTIIYTDGLIGYAHY